MSADTTATAGPDDAEPTPWVTVYNAANLEEAHIVMGALEASNIPAVLRRESTSSLFGAVSLGGVDVQVPPERAEEALTVLAPDGEAPEAE